MTASNRELAGRLAKVLFEKYVKLYVIFGINVDEGTLKTIVKQMQSIIEEELDIIEQERKNSLRPVWPQQEPGVDY